MILRILVLSILFSTANAFCQDHPAYTDAFHSGANEYQVWAGYSPDSITWIGKSEARRLFMAGGGWRRVLLGNNSVAWKFRMDAGPIALIPQPNPLGLE